MKVVILAGGLGSRLAEETTLKPKPLVEIGDQPILWHILQHYAHYGYDDFIICLGYKGYMIKEYFNNFYLHNSDVTIILEDYSRAFLNSSSRKWKITLIDTGKNTMTGGRLKRISKYIDSDFMLTYGDGVSNVNINDLIARHKHENKLATMTVVNPLGRFGTLSLEGNKIRSFEEKVVSKSTYINAGYFVLSPEIFKYIDGDDSIWEQGPLQKLCSEDQLVAHKHNGFWQPMDTLRDKIYLNNLLDEGKADWIHAKDTH